MSSRGSGGDSSTGRGRGEEREADAEVEPEADAEAEEEDDGIEPEAARADGEDAEEVGREEADHRGVEEVQRANKRIAVAMQIRTDRPANSPSQVMSVGWYAEESADSCRGAVAGGGEGEVRRHHWPVGTPTRQNASRAESTLRARREA